MKKEIKNILLRLVLLTGLAGFIALVVVAKVNRERTPVQGISVSIDGEPGKQLVRGSDILALVNRNFVYEGRSMSGRILRRIEKRIEAVPQVRRASAYIDDRHRLRIRVSQREPVARVFAVSGQSFYVGRDGIKFPLSAANTVKVPVITGFIEEEGKVVEPVRTPALKDACKVLSRLQEVREWRAMIGQVHVNEQREIELVPRIGEAVILLGTPDDLDVKMKKLVVFYTEVLGRVGWDKYKVINIMYKDQIIGIK